MCRNVLIEHSISADGDATLSQKQGFGSRWGKNRTIITQIWRSHIVGLNCIDQYILSWLIVLIITYIGLHLSASGLFSYAQTELYKKSLTAYNKLYKNLLSLNPSISTSLHVFDQTIKQILLNRSEIWGTYNPFSARFRNGTLSFKKNLFQFWMWATT